MKKIACALFAILLTIVLALLGPQLAGGEMTATLLRTASALSLVTGLVFLNLAARDMQ